MFGHVGPRGVLNEEGALVLAQLAPPGHCFFEVCMVVVYALMWWGAVCVGGGYLQLPP